MHKLSTHTRLLWQRLLAIEETLKKLPAIEETLKKLPAIEEMLQKVLNQQMASSSSPSS